MTRIAASFAPAVACGYIVLCVATPAQAIPIQIEATELSGRVLGLPLTIVPLQTPSLMYTLADFGLGASLTVPAPVLSLNEGAGEAQSAANAGSAFAIALHAGNMAGSGILFLP